VAEVYWFDSKIESLMLYLDHYLIASTKDQTIKVVQYTQLPQLKRAHKKGGLVVRPNEENKE
jgi:hypothetical protein